MAESRHGVNWSHEETLAAFFLYLRLPSNRMDDKDRAVISLAEALGRTPNSVALKLANLKSKDPNRTGKGLANASKQDRQVWEEYLEDGDALFNQALEQYLAFIKPKRSEPVEYEGTLDIITIPEGKDVIVTTTRRVHQNYFRNLLVELYGGRCCITGLMVPQLLVASHIKPWRDADPLTERINVENGLLLNSLHDKAFDCGLITLTDDYSVLTSKALENRLVKDDNEALRWVCQSRGRKIWTPRYHKPNLEFIRYHREAIFRG